MLDMGKVIKGLECCADSCRNGCPYAVDDDCEGALCADALALLKEHEVMSPDEFKNGLLKMFSSIWDCEIEHPVFQDKVGDLMSAVLQLYKQAVKWNA